MGTLGMAQAQQAKVFIQNYTAAPGAKVKVDIQGDANLKSIGAVQFELDFATKTPADQPDVTVTTESVPDGASTRLRPVITPGALIVKPFITDGAVASPTHISGAVVNDLSTAPASGPGVLASLEFTVPAGAASGTVYSLNLVPAGTNVTDPSANPIAITLEGGTITVQKPAIPPSGIISVVGGSVANGKVTVTVATDKDILDVGGIDLTLAYDPAVLSLPADAASRVALGTILEGGNFAANVPTPGTLKIAALGGDPAKAGAGTLFTITFDVAAGASGSTTVTPTVTSMLNGTGDPIKPVSVTPGTVEVAVAKVSLGSGSADLGKTANIDVTLDAAAKGVAGATLVVSLGPDVTINPANLANGTILKGTVQADAAPVAGSPGEFRVTIVGSQAGDGPGTLVTIPVTVNASAPGGQHALTVVSSELRDINGTIIASQAGTAGTLTITVPPPTPAGVVSVQAGAAPQGGTAVVNVVADKDLTNIGGIELTLTFDPAVLSLPTDPTALVSRVALGDLLTGGQFQANIIAPGKLKIAALAGDTAKSGPGTLVTVTFDVAGSAKAGASAIGLTVDNSVNGSGNPTKPATVNPGSVTVAPFGDLSHNGVLDIEDIRLGIQLLFQASPNPADVALVDVNGNGKVDLKDLRILLRRILNLPTP
jgi:hypothetical protein